MSRQRSGAGGTRTGEARRRVRGPHGARRDATSTVGRPARTRCETSRRDRRQPGRPRCLLSVPRRQTRPSPGTWLRAARARPLVAWSIRASASRRSRIHARSSGSLRSRSAVFDRGDRDIESIGLAWASLEHDDRGPPRCRRMPGAGPARRRPDPRVSPGATTTASRLPSRGGADAASRRPTRTSSRWPTPGMSSGDLEEAVCRGAMLDAASPRDGSCDTRNPSLRARSGAGVRRASWSCTRLPDAEHLQPSAGRCAGRNCGRRQRWSRRRRCRATTTTRGWRSRSPGGWPIAELTGQTRPLSLCSGTASAGSSGPASEAAREPAHFAARRAQRDHDDGGRRQHRLAALDR